MNCNKSSVDSIPAPPPARGFRGFLGFPSFLGFSGFLCFRGGARVAVFLVFLAFLVFFDFGVGVKAGGLGYGLLSRWGRPAWVRFPLLAILSCALAVLTFRATRAVVGCYIWSRPFGNAHAGSRTRVTSMGGLYDAATLHAPW